MQITLIKASFVAAMLCSATANADVINVSKDVFNGTFALIDSGPAVAITELLVQEIGYGVSESTTLPGWTSAQVAFGVDPLGCQSDTGSTISIGFCYKLTNSKLGVPITAALTSFSYDSTGDDGSIPSEFTVLFTTTAGVGGCVGNTGVGGGCTVAVDEPPSAAILLPVLGVVCLCAVGTRTLKANPTQGECRS